MIDWIKIDQIRDEIGSEIKKNEAKYSTFYSSSKTETVINESDIDDVFELIYSTIKSDMQKLLGKSLGRITNSFVDQNTNCSKYKSLSGSSYIKSSK